ncbi:amino acid ABC transporter permease [Skermanella sp. TT6]|uniref:Amino acid ABC transporter permease n=1 Tax=Skermanella cutis TaxID=2775420 RepID=A0ABX7BA03_9PROT|nr:amino acid ABC transporter permease [Skermanella sp. TT6]QQP91206.1 amino acid ABC transporter permease [Skermanella sp. TT6]
MAISTRGPGNLAPQAPRRSLINDPNVRAIFFQILVLGGVVLLGWYLVSNVLENLARQNIATGFSFLDREASFAIGEAMIPYSPASSYSQALLVGFLNTIKVAVLGIILATVLGTIIGIARLSSNFLVAKLASIYVEVIRNVPVLLQLFFWYAVISESLPQPRQALNPIPGVFLSNRGMKFPSLADDPIWTWVGLALVAAMVGVWLLARWARKRQEATGQQFPVVFASIGLLLALPLLTWVVGGAPTALDVPVLQGFNFRGGITISPEFAALLMGLVIYTAGFIAEIVRSGIRAVNWGQTEAASALGLHRGEVLRLVVLPQALRIIVPPTTSQYLNLTKNSSLAVAIGYPDLVSVANTTLNQTGQAIEAVSIMMAVYLTISLGISLFMNWYNTRIALVER